MTLVNLHGYDGKVKAPPLLFKINYLFYSFFALPSVRILVDKYLAVT